MPVGNIGTLATNARVAENIGFLGEVKWQVVWGRGDSTATWPVMASSQDMWFIKAAMSGTISKSGIVFFALLETLCVPCSFIDTMPELCHT